MKGGGGARSGAGRKKTSPTLVTPELAAAKPGESLDPRPTLELVATGQIEVSVLQFKALIALLPYSHTKKGDGGKKDGKREAAKKAASGKFASTKPPVRLVR